MSCYTLYLKGWNWEKSYKFRSLTHVNAFLRAYLLKYPRTLSQADIREGRLLISRYAWI